MRTRSPSCGMWPRASSNSPANVAEELRGGRWMPSQEVTASTVRRPGMSHEPSGWRQASGPAGMSPIWPASTLTRSVGVMQPTTLPYSSRTKARGVGSSRNVSSISVREACSKIVGAERSRGRTLQTRPPPSSCGAAVPGCSVSVTGPWGVTAARSPVWITPSTSSLSGSSTGSQGERLSLAKRQAVA